MSERQKKMSLAPRFSSSRPRGRTRAHTRGRARLRVGRQPLATIADPVHSRLCSKRRLALRSPSRLCKWKIYVRHLSFLCFICERAIPSERDPIFKHLPQVEHGPNYSPSPFAFPSSLLPSKRVRVALPRMYGARRSSLGPQSPRSPQHDSGDVNEPPPTGRERLAIRFLAGKLGFLFTIFTTIETRFRPANASEDFFYKRIEQLREPSAGVCAFTNDVYVCSRDHDQRAGVISSRGWSGRAAKFF